MGSGTVFRSNVGGGEWRPSKFTRIILTSEMFTRSRARTRATKCDDDEESRAEFRGLVPVIYVRDNWSGGCSNRG